MSQPGIIFNFYEVVCMNHRGHNLDKGYAIGMVTLPRGASFGILTTR